MRPLAAALSRRFAERADPSPLRSLERFPTPAPLAKFLRPETVQTPMLDLIDSAVMSAATGEHRRWIINCPPQEGKSWRMQIAALWLLLHDPTRRVVFASYEQGLAQTSTLAVRQFVEMHGKGVVGRRADLDRNDALGIGIDPSRAAAGSWALARTEATPRPGSLLAVGVGSGFTGRPADVLILDDPIKDARQADSQVIRRGVQNWFEAVAAPRLGASAIVIVVQTRWHEDDPAGWLLTNDVLNEWQHLAVPAQALSAQERERSGAGPDPLGRAPGEWMISAREGRDAAAWQRIKATKSSRWWAAMYQQVPAPPEGGIFHREWFDRDRLTSAPPMARTIVVVDPADNEGDGDEAGIIVAGNRADKPGIAVLADRSGHCTVDTWFRRSYFATFEFDASAIYYERSLSRLRQAAVVTWKRLRTEARVLVETTKLHGVPAPSRITTPDLEVLAAASRKLATDEDTDADRRDQAKRLAEVWPWADRILAAPVTGPPVRALPATTGSKAYRAELVSPLYEARHVAHVGPLRELEHEQATWQPGQSSPNRMDANVHALLELSRTTGAGAVAQSTAAPLERHTAVIRPARIPVSAATVRR